MSDGHFDSSHDCDFWAEYEWQFEWTDTSPGSSGWWRWRWFWGGFIEWFWW